MDFKPGDKVKRIKPSILSSRVQEGNIYTVDRVIGIGKNLVLCEAGSNDHWHPANFELVKRPKKFKCGDKVRRIHPVPEGYKKYGMKLDSTYTITNITEGGSLEFDNVPFPWPSDYFEFVEAEKEQESKPEPMFKPGDIVKRITPAGQHNEIKYGMKGFYLVKDINPSGDLIFHNIPYSWPSTDFEIVKTTRLYQSPEVAPGDLVMCIAVEENQESTDKIMKQLEIRVKAWVANYHHVNVDEIVVQPAEDKDGNLGFKVVFRHELFSPIEKYLTGK